MSRWCRSPRRSSLRGLLLRLAPVGLFLLVAHHLDKLLIGRGSDDLVALDAVVRDEADALDDDVVDEPPLAAPEHPVVDRDLRPLLGRDRHLDGRLVAVDRFPHVGDLFPAVELGLGDIGALEEVGEELEELIPLGRHPRGPVACQRALRGLFEVEDAAGDFPDLALPIPGPVLLLELWILQNLDHPVDLGAQLICGLAGLRGSGRKEQRHDSRKGLMTLPQRVTEHRCSTRQRKCQPRGSETGRARANPNREMRLSGNREPLAGCDANYRDSARERFLRRFFQGPAQNPRTVERYAVLDGAFGRPQTAAPDTYTT